MFWTDTKDECFPHQKSIILRRKLHPDIGRSDHSISKRGWRLCPQPGTTPPPRRAPLQLPAPQNPEAGVQEPSSNYFFWGGPAGRSTIKKPPFGVGNKPCLLRISAVQDFLSFRTKTKGPIACSYLMGKKMEEHLACFMFFPGLCGDVCKELLPIKTDLRIFISRIIPTASWSPSPRLAAQLSILSLMDRFEGILENGWTWMELGLLKMYYLVSNEQNKKSGNISTSFGCTKLKFWISSRHNSGCTSCWFSQSMSEVVKGQRFFFDPLTNLSFFSTSKKRNQAPSIEGWWLNRVLVFVGSVGF